MPATILPNRLVSYTTIRPDRDGSYTTIQPDQIERARQQPTENDVIKYYTGVGARSTPPDVLKFMTKMGSWLARHGYTLRSGGAPGADSAFEEGAKAEGKSSDIYLPWPKFKGHPSPLCFPSEVAESIVSEVHPNWKACSQSARKLHARNVHQVLGDDVTEPVKSDFLVCWTHGGLPTGGTGMTIKLAKMHHIPVFNLANEGEGLRLRAFIDSPHEMTGE